MGRKESYSERLQREGGIVASGKFKGDRREATCECCHRNDAPVGERLCASCASYIVVPPSDPGDEWVRRSALVVTQQACEAAEAERDRLERINARLTKDLADLQRANDHLRSQIKEMHRAALAGEDKP